MAKGYIYIMTNPCVDYYHNSKLSLKYRPKPNCAIYTLNMKSIYDEVAQILDSL